MPQVMRILPVLAVLAIAACDARDHTRDAGIDAHSLTDLQAGIWIDPNGCDHWIIDDGVEGYMSQRLDRFGRPVCSGLGEPGTAIWDENSDRGLAEGIF